MDEMGIFLKGIFRNSEQQSDPTSTKEWLGSERIVDSIISNSEVVLFIQIPIDSLWFFFLFFGIITNLDFANR
jgi:hypothetical protein